MNNYTVTVGNIGIVYEGTNGFTARQLYGTYKRQSADNYGRAAGEDVTVLMNDDILYEYQGHNSSDE